LKRKIRIILLDEAESEYKKLNELVDKQINDGKENTEEIQLLRSINQKFEFIKENPFYGDHISTKILEQSKYNVQNLWRVELINFWRMLY